MTHAIQTNQIQLITYVDRLSGGKITDLHKLLRGPLAGLFDGWRCAQSALVTLPPLSAIFFTAAGDGPPEVEIREGDPE